MAVIRRSARVVPAAGPAHAVALHTLISHCYHASASAAKNAINCLTQGDGGDIPEIVFCALMHAMPQLPPASVLFLFLVVVQRRLQMPERLRMEHMASSLQLLLLRTLSLLSSMRLTRLAANTCSRFRVARRSGWTRISTTLTM